MISSISNAWKIHTNEDKGMHNFIIEIYSIKIASISYNYKSMQSAYLLLTCKISLRLNYISKEKPKKILEKRIRKEN